MASPALYVTAAAINPVTGSLSLLPEGPYFTHAASISIALDPLGKFVFTANDESNDVSAFAIAPGGAISEVAGSPFATGRTANCIVVDASGKFVYVTNALDNTVSGYAINRATGVLTEIAGSPFAIGLNALYPQFIALDPLGKFAYVANGSSSSISSFTIDPATGALTLVPGGFAAPQGASAVAVHPNGKFVYVATGFDIEGFTHDASTGKLTPMALQPAVPGGRASALVVDPSGRSLYVIDTINNSVDAFAIDPAIGNLSIIAGTPFFLVTPIPGVGNSGPTSIVVSN